MLGKICLAAISQATCAGAKTLENVLRIFKQHRYTLLYLCKVLDYNMFLHYTLSKITAKKRRECLPIGIISTHGYYSRLLGGLQAKPHQFKDKYFSP